MNITLTWRDENIGRNRVRTAFRIYDGPLQDQKAEHEAMIRAIHTAGFCWIDSKACWGADGDVDAADRALLRELAAAGFEIAQAGCKRVLAPDTAA